MKTKTKIDRATVLQFFQEGDFTGHTADDAVAHFGARHYSTVTARITELRDKGLLYPTGVRRMTRRNRLAAVLAPMIAS